MRIKYNAPFTLTFALLVAAVLLINQFVYPSLIQMFFTVGAAGSFHWEDPLSYLRLVSHVIGHSGWDHFLGNFSFILLLGPVLEEKYSTPFVIIMTILTALVTGILNSLFFSTGLLGASGIVFMMIILISFTNISSGEIPMTFFAILILFLGKEIFNAFQNDDISQFAHILGGIAGSVFGFFGAHLSEGKTGSPPVKSGNP